MANDEGNTTDNRMLAAENDRLRARLERLEAAHADLTHLIAAAEVGTLFLDTDLRIERFTRPITDFFQLEDSDLGRRLEDVGPRLFGNDLVQVCERVLVDGIPHEKEILTENGRCYLRRVSPHRSGGSEFGGVIASFIDITERRTAESHLRNLASVLRDSNDAVIISTLDHKITDWNRGAERAYGYSEKEVLELDLYSVVPDEYRTTVEDVTKRTVDGESVATYETQRTTKDGRILDVEVTITPLKNWSGKITRIARTERDITARLQKEEEIRQLNADLERRVADRTSALAASDYRMRAILDATGDAIVSVKSDGTIETFNESATRMFGYSVAEAIGSSVLNLLSPRYLAMGSPALLHQLGFDDADGHCEIRELMGRRKDGSEFPVQVTVAPVDHLGLFISVIRDVTEQRSLQEEILRIAADEQRRIGEELHDGTQQELTGLGLLAQQLAEIDPASDPQEVRRLASRLARGIEDSNRQVQRLAKGLIPVAIDADGLMVALAELAERTAAETGLECTFVCPEPVHMQDDIAALHAFRIVQEAVNNALKHASARHIEIRLERSAGLTSISILDDGVGIPADSRAKGGLGLRLMGHRCDLIGGTFSVRRRPGNGTEVRCQIPTTLSEHAK